jgi:radical SAM superfamily enzyme YgiQ (UPF0313 family)
MENDSALGERKMKVLLVYPETPVTYWSFKYAVPFVRKKALLPPLGLLTVAAMLPDSVEVQLVDMNTDVLESSDILHADLVLVSAMIVQKKSFEEVVQRCNRLGRKVAAGGPYPTSMHESIKGVDYFVLGEGEQVVPRFFADILAGKAERVDWGDKETDIGRAPVPRFELVNLHNYTTISLQYSRGCPFDCEFCDVVHLFGHKSRTKSPEQFLTELDAAFATGFRGSLFIVDDNFIGNKKNVKELLRAVIPWQKKHKFPFNFLTEASVNLADDDELLDLMVEANFTMAFLGIETPVEASLAEMGKKQNLKADLIESVRKIEGRGIEVTGGFVIGFDSDPPDIFERQIEFIQELGIPTAMIGLLMALPGTKLYRRLKEEGRLLHESSGNNTHEGELNFVTKIPADRLIAGYHRVLSSVYDPKLYFDRCITLLRRFPESRRRPPEGLEKRITLNDLRALRRSLLRQTFSSYGFQYLSFLIRSLFVSPLFFPTAVEMAVQGHHFFTITAATIRGRKTERSFQKSRKGITLEARAERNRPVLAPAYTQFFKED